MSGPTITRKVHFGQGRRGTRTLKPGEPPQAQRLPPPVPRDTRLMAFAIVFDEWLATGKIRDYAELAAISGLDRSAITRIMNLRLLEPKGQERRLMGEENFA